MSVRLPDKNKYYPKDTQDILASLKQIIVPGNWNFYFLFNMPFISEDKNGLPNKIRINENVKQFKWNKELLKNLKSRKEKLMQSLELAGFKVERIEAICNWRLIIGLGASHPQETSMTLHHIYGIPYIPGSAIKGVTRHWAILKFSEEKAKSEGKDFLEVVKEIANALESGKEINLEVYGINFRQLIEIFGTQKKQGEVIFMDAFPVENINLKIDIMNPHYPDYYGKGKPPADWQNPNPIKFLTVEKTNFLFVLASKEEKLVESTLKLLTEALKEHGIGAKTSLGYGIFHISG